MTQTENLIADGEPLMTREQLLQFLNAAGFPISRSSLNKLCSPAAGAPRPRWTQRRRKGHPGEHQSV